MEDVFEAISSENPMDKATVEEMTFCRSIKTALVTISSTGANICKRGKRHYRKRLKLRRFYCEG
ncbi:hypothetical protein KY290_014241 [Solanum tuberosum]|uniref:Uncharacterized protein n=1 Tax=Solanum tuberosum TaxID=4113 RepID=A0ABQ7VP34_SOLTU|nr:hypothetical protein KY289_014303 [Solanum tuberosum]KAH0701054.1 hypothetical protein KY284_015269 [Solanum tuberosum]KAH0770260.1 hypothetical protein KY290_014241 [Solanum tuberosum]